MSQNAWSWALFAVSVFGLWLTGQSPKAGWWFAIANQGIWGAYATLTRQWGLIAMSAVFVAIYARNLWRWRHTPMQPRRYGRQAGLDAPRPAGRAGELAERAVHDEDLVVAG